MPPRLVQGDIYWVDQVHGQHDTATKRRPVVLVDEQDILDDQRFPLLGVAITTGEAGEDAVELPGRDQLPNTRTGLPKTSFASPGWRVAIEDPTLIGERIGCVSALQLTAIIEAIDSRDWVGD